MNRALVWLSTLLVLAACDSPGGQATPNITPDVTDAGPDKGDAGPDEGDAYEPCSDGVKGGDETDVDCGGRCGPCADGKACATGADCESGACSANHVCVTSACGNGTQDPGETGIDCGGSCPGCYGDPCSANGQCVSGYCKEGACADATCSDGVRNGGETGVDCGGDCPLCADGNGCLTGANCVSGYCKAGVCATPSCTDGAKNGNETDVDCGGVCPKCELGEACGGNGDCESGKCTGGACVEVLPACDDGIKNGTESDVDCGGSCAGCAYGKQCGGDEDCASGTCKNATCDAPASCEDGQKNGGETDVDCGGATCPQCPVNKNCAGPTDCLSEACIFGVCQMPTCDDGQKNQGESDVDCGGPKCDGCALGGKCSGGGDCVSGICDGGVCVSCDDGEKNGDETGVDCGGACGATCADGEACGGVGDCASGRCEGGKCTSCQDGVQNGSETDVDCGGSVCPACSAGGKCVSAGDCATSGCEGGVCCELNACGACGALPTEVCNGVDDDCDGETDEAADVGAPPACDEQQGVCAGAVAACKGAQGWVCGAAEYGAASPSYEATEDSCDGKDNDCDGQTDELAACDACGAEPLLFWDPAGSSSFWKRTFFVMDGVTPAATMNVYGTPSEARLLYGTDSDSLLEQAAVGGVALATAGGKLYAAWMVGGASVTAKLAEVAPSGATTLDSVAVVGTHDHTLAIGARDAALAWAYVDKATGKTRVRHRNKASDAWTTVDLYGSALNDGRVALAYDGELALHTAHVASGGPVVTLPDGTKHSVWAGSSATDLRLVVDDAGTVTLAYTHDGAAHIEVLHSDGLNSKDHVVPGGSSPYLGLAPDGTVVAGWIADDALHFGRPTKTELVPLGSLTWSGTKWPSALNFVVGEHNVLHAGVLETVMKPSLVYVTFCPGASTGGVCTPSCGGKQCGSDGCGGSCGECQSWEFCSASGTCLDDSNSCGFNAANTCAGHCGEPGPSPNGGCYCDTSCTASNDCCPDFFACCVND